jgi:hypothetical protein
VGRDATDNVVAAVRGWLSTVVVAWSGSVSVCSAADDEMESNANEDSVRTNDKSELMGIVVVGEGGAVVVSLAPGPAEVVSVGKLMIMLDEMLVGMLVGGTVIVSLGGWLVGPVGLLVGGSVIVSEVDTDVGPSVGPPDVGVETGSDVGVVTGSDVGVVTGSDVDEGEGSKTLEIPETMLDIIPPPSDDVGSADVGVETGSDVGVETGSDVGVETGSDVGVETGSDEGVGPKTPERSLGIPDVMLERSLRIPDKTLERLGIIPPPSDDDGAGVIVESLAELLSLVVVVAMVKLSLVSEALSEEEVGVNDVGSRSVVTSDKALPTMLVALPTMPVTPPARPVRSRPPPVFKVVVETDCEVNSVEDVAESEVEVELSDVEELLDATLKEVESERAVGGSFSPGLLFPGFSSPPWFPVMESKGASHILRVSVHIAVVKLWILTNKVSNVVKVTDIELPLLKVIALVQGTTCMGVGG